MEFFPFQITANTCEFQSKRILHDRINLTELYEYSQGSHGVGMGGGERGERGGGGGESSTNISL